MINPLRGCPKKKPIVLYVDFQQRGLTLPDTLLTYSGRQEALMEWYLRPYGGVAVGSRRRIYSPTVKRRGSDGTWFREGV